MSEQFINYGIDLGTTNSAISKFENGNVKILKSTEGMMDTTPSVIHFNKAGNMFVGLKAYNQINTDIRKTIEELQKKGSAKGLNTFFEFKRTMGTDKTYQCSNTENCFTSEELSAEILKKLKTYVQDDIIKAAVITVPAKFRQNQLDATQKAAELAGFEYCELIQEPIAASIAYGIDSKKIQGYWLVFDFGGGTFDVAIMKVNDGIMKVIDTEGDNHLGGKDIDYCIVDNIFIPYLNSKYDLSKIIDNENSNQLLRDSLKRYAEEIKIELATQDSATVYVDDIGEDSIGVEMIINKKLTISDFEKTTESIFQRAINITNNLIKRNNLNQNDLETIILVGGMTLSKTLRKMIKSQISNKIITSVDPMTAVAKGAGLFASAREIPVKYKTFDKSKIQLILKYPQSTVELEETFGLRINRKVSIGKMPNKIFIEIIRDDRAWSSGITEIINDTEIFTLPLIQSKYNTFTITVFDDFGNNISCEPSSITINQGLKPAEATLPYNIGIDLFDSAKGQIGVYTLKGLEKNTTLPAKGKGIFKTQKDIRPGNPNDFLKIEIYECGYKEEGSRKILNELTTIINITGEELPQFLPANSEVEVTIDIDSSRRMHFSAYFPYFDDSVDLKIPEQRQKEFDASDLFFEIKNARCVLESFQDDGEIEEQRLIEQLNNELAELEELLEKGKADYNTKTMVMERLREVLKRIDNILESNEWPKVEDELKWIFDRAKTNGQRYGKSGTQGAIEQYQLQVNTVIKQSNIKLAKDLIEELRSFNFNLIKDDIGFWINYIKNFEINFTSYGWINPQKAKQLIEDAKNIISTAPSKEKIEQIVRELYSLLPEKEKQAISENDETTLMR
jgi:molecular chaperone DnaK